MIIELNISYALKFYLTLYSDWKVSINNSILQMSKLWLTKKLVKIFPSLLSLPARFLLFLLGIMASFRSLVKPHIVEKRTKKLIQCQSDHCLTIKCNGEKHRCGQESEERIQGPDLIAQHWLLARLERKACNAQWFPNGSKNWKCSWCAPNHTVVRWLSVFPLRTAKPPR